MPPVSIRYSQYKFIAFLRTNKLDNLLQMGCCVKYLQLHFANTYTTGADYIEDKGKLEIKKIAYFHL